jgi:hypothetical protein
VTKKNDPGTGRIERAVELLAEEARARLAAHPHAHLLAGAREDLALSLPIPTRPQRNDTPEHVAALARGLSESLDGALEALLAHRAAVRPGVVFCLRCRSAGCGHGEPPGPRQVFAGYGATGLPRFQDLGQLLLECGEERVDRLYGRSRDLLARVFVEDALTGELLPAYREVDNGYHLHGQVVAGWYTLPDDSGRPATLAVTLQIVSTRPTSAQPGGARRRYGVNVLGRTPDGSPLEHLHDTLGEVPWSDSVRWAQRILDDLGKGRASKKPSPEALKKRMEGILGSMARRLEKDRRSRDRKTRHGRERHSQGDRPTPMALPDLARAPERDILVDVRAETLVVLGDRGRAHVFTPAGKLVTSVRYNPASIARRRQRGQWRPAKTEEAAALRQAVAAVAEGSS